MTKEQLPFICIAFYIFTPIEDPKSEIKQHKSFFKDRDITSRIYISESGINGQMSASREAGQEYMDWMHSRPEFKDIHFKIHNWHEQAFPRQTVKYREKLVAYDESVDLSISGEHVSPKKWKEMLDSKKDYHLIDVRNNYEWEVGRFDGADLPPCETFREFEEYAENLKETKDPESTPVMMYCTGGIRCELYSSVLMKKGFKNVYQLNGGVINYGLKEGSSHWLGKLFVFDDRLTVPISQEETPVIGKCRLCKAPSDSYYNCANMDCNTLYLCCKECLTEYTGCCGRDCQGSDRIRPYQDQNPHKPFRRKHLCQ